MRYLASINEAYAESQVTCRIQLSFYFAFSLIVSQPKWEMADCIMKEALPQDTGLFTFNVQGWHYMPILLFSSLSSVLAITMAQFNFYKTRHEYEMTVVGKVCYIFSTLFLVIAKLSGQVLMTVGFYCLVLSSNYGNVAQFFLLAVPLILTHYIYNLKNYVINIICASKYDSGYKLDSKFLPTTARLGIEMDKFKDVNKNSKSSPQKILELCYFGGENFEKLSTTLKSICMCICVPWNCMIDGSAARANINPGVFNFRNTIKSRNKYRSRFITALGMYLPHCNKVGIDSKDNFQSAQISSRILYFLLFIHLLYTLC